METVCSSETMLSTYASTRRHIPEQQHRHHHRRQRGQKIIIKNTDIEIYEIKENIRHHTQDNTENNIRGEENNSSVGTNEEHLENKDSGEDAEQKVARDKLREELKIMWYKVRLLQMSERQRLPKVIENNELIHLKKDINGIIEEFFKEDETDITDINHLIYSAATVITERITKPGKKVKNRRNKDSWKIRIQRQISNWRTELSILTESGSSSDNIKLNIKKTKIFQKRKVTNATEIAQLI
jgi:hypothetical protein